MTTSAARSRQPVNKRITTLLSSLTGHFDYAVLNELLSELISEQDIYVPFEPSDAECDRASLFDRSEAPHLSIGLSYCLKRAIRGCGSDKDVARTNCAVILSSLIDTFSSILSPPVLLSFTRTLLSPKVIGSGKGNADERIIGLSKLAVYSVLLRWSAFKASGVCEEALLELSHLKGRKSYFSLPADLLILSFAEECPERAVFLLDGHLKDGLLGKALLSLAGQPVTIDLASREVLDCLPRQLHPAVKVIAKRQDLQVGHLLTGCKESQLLGLLIIRESARIPTEFYALSERWEGAKRTKSPIDDHIKAYIGKIYEMEAASMQRLSFDAMAERLSCYPHFAMKRVPFGLLITDFNEYSKAVCRLKNVGAQIECFFAPLRALKQIDSAVVIDFFFTQYGHAREAAQAKMAQYLCSLASAEMSKACAEITRKFHKLSGCSEPFVDAIKASKKIGSDELGALANSFIATILMVSGEMDCFEMMQELRSFVKECPSDQERSLFWSEAVISLLSMTPAYVRRLAEELFKVAVKLDAIKDIDAVCNVIEKRPDTSEDFDIEEDDSDVEAEEDVSNVQVDKENVRSDKLQGNDSSEDINEEEMEALDSKLAAAVSLHIRANAAKKQVQQSSVLLQGKCIGLMEVVGRSREISPLQKFAFLPRLLQCLTLVAVLKKREDYLDRLSKAVKGIIESCRNESSFDWSILAKNLLDSRQSANSDIIALVVIFASRNCAELADLQECFADSLKKPLHFMFAVKLMNSLTKFSQGKLILSNLNKTILNNIATTTKPFLANQLLKALRTAISSQKSSQDIVDWAVDWVIGDIGRSLGGKAYYIRTQLTELHMWAKIDKGIYDRLSLLRSRLSDPKLIDQLDGTLKMIGKH